MAPFRALHLPTVVDKRRDGKHTAAHVLLAFLTAFAMLSHAEAAIITADANSERITLPSPATPDLAAARSGCPHEAAQLIPWHDPAAWTGGAVPATAGEAATLAAGVTVLLQGEPTGAGSASMPLSLLTIPSTSELVLGENVTSGTLLHAHGIAVKGALRAGAESCRLEARVSIVLHGARPAGGEVVESWYKGIVVSGAGTLELQSSMLQAPSWWCHSSPPYWPPGAGSAGSWLRFALGTNHQAAQGPMEGCDATIRPGQSRRSCG